MNLYKNTLLRISSSISKHVSVNPIIIALYMHGGGDSMGMLA